MVLKVFLMIGLILKKGSNVLGEVKEIKNIIGVKWEKIWYG